MYLVKLLGKCLNDDVAICDLFSVHLYEWQHPFLAAELALVVNILKRRKCQKFAFRWFKTCDYFFALFALLYFDPGIALL